MLMWGNKYSPFYFIGDDVTLYKLREMTHIYARDTNNYVFSDIHIDMFINQAIDRLRQYKVFQGMSYLEYSDDEPILLPSQYHYLLALFAASRCFDIDERFYEGVEKRNEFESLLDDLIADIQAGNIVITDKDGNTVEDGSCYTEYVVDAYFDNKHEITTENIDDLGVMD